MSTIDYQNNAQERVKLALAEPSAAEALTIAQIATAEATLALVEQQRIANLIAMFNLSEDDASDAADLGFDYLAAAKEIREGLGL